VLIDTQWLTTLSDRDFAAGLAEVVKAGFIYDNGIIAAIGDKTLSEIRASEKLTLELIERAVKVKAEVVSADFKEDFNREILNYGHTFGHAIELDCKYSLRHGECVSIGMVFIAELAFSLGLMQKELLDLHRQILTNLSLPITYVGQSWETLYANMRIDKKTRGNLLRFVAVTEIGKTQRLEGPSETSLRQAYEKVCS
jgi:3-dehydroquinate synthase